ncbi:MAG: hypothetical protein LBB90_04450, partial [Tannerella sp.]|nr:hypothetical protein [Tannerella sp.]
ALTLCEEAAFSPEELEVYEDYWDQVRKEMGLFDSARTEGKAKGRAEGKAEGMTQGLAKGKAEGKAEGRAEGKAEGLAEGMAQGMVQGMAQAVIAAAQNNFSIEQIRLFSGLSEERIREILERGNCTRG